MPENFDITKRADLSESLEDYLETILDLETKHKVARAKDIAVSLGIKSGSVTGALKILKEKKLINYEPYSYITLTEEGKKIAENIKYRHGVIKDFLVNILDVDEDNADETACRMEHVIDKETLTKLASFIEHVTKSEKTSSLCVLDFQKSVQD